jgi:hypothetical protein
MAAQSTKSAFRIASLVGLGLMALSLSTPASAQGIFERIFGGLRQAIEAPARAPSIISSFADPYSSSVREDQRADNGPARAFCVRSCDGRFFPVQAHAGMSAAESCHSFCPASQTKLYSGSNIDYAVANDGTRYADSDNAFVYRQRLVEGCSCNGRQSGLARMDATTDPTLRPGDVVATKTGLIAFTGTKNNVADFTPIDTYRGLSKNSRDKLADVKIMPASPGATEVTAATITRTRAEDRRRVQLER